MIGPMHDAYTIGMPILAILSQFRSVNQRQTGKAHEMKICWLFIYTLLIVKTAAAASQPVDEYYRTRMHKGKGRKKPTRRPKSGKRPTSSPPTASPTTAMPTKSQNPSENPSQNPSENPSENPSSKNLSRNDSENPSDGQQSTQKPFGEPEE